MGESMQGDLDHFVLMAPFSVLLWSNVCREWPGGTQDIHAILAEKLIVRHRDEYMRCTGGIRQDGIVTRGTLQNLDDRC
jgi:hypothetical protein